MSEKIVVERDFRQPIYRDANPEDYEFRTDGSIARKDRWEKAVMSIRDLLNIDAREFEIDDVVLAVEKMVGSGVWESVTSDEYPHIGDVTNIRLHDGSILSGARYKGNSEDSGVWIWRDIAFTSDVSAWLNPG
jgi:hypothetical protein